MPAIKSQIDQFPFSVDTGIPAFPSENSRPPKRAVDTHNLVPRQG